MIGRIWHGWTTPENADVLHHFDETAVHYELVLKV